MVLIEALSCQVPIIAADCHSGPREILREGYFGILVPPNNSDALSNAVIDYLNNKISIPASREECLSRAKEFDLTISVQNYLDTFGALLQ